MLFAFIYFITLITATDDSATRLATQKYVDKKAQECVPASTTSSAKSVTNIDVNNGIYTLPWKTSELEESTNMLMFIHISFTYNYNNGYYQFSDNVQLVTNVNINKYGDAGFSFISSQSYQYTLSLGVNTNDVIISIRYYDTGDMAANNVINDFKINYIVII